MQDWSLSEWCHQSRNVSNGYEVMVWRICTWLYAVFFGTRFSRLDGLPALAGP
jgi:hypothetical protein